MKVVIAGTRTFEDYEKLKFELDRIRPFMEITEIVSGCSRGADTLGERYAMENDILLKKFPADWKGLGRKAGPLRNIQMAEYADELIAFWDTKSGGTKHMINEMDKRNKPIIIIRIDNEA